MSNDRTDVGAAWTRRDVLKTLAAAGAACAVPSAAYAAKPKPIPVAAQLYSVRDDCKQDFDAAMAKIAAMGFEGVEFAGYYNYGGKPADLKKRLDALNLKAAGTHIGTGSISGDALKKTIEFHQAIGCRYLIVPGDGAFTDPEKSKGLAETFTRAAEKLKPLGMYCGYHNHTNEFKKDGDKTYWELFAERTSKDVVLQQDVGWTVAAKLDPVVFIKKYPGRTRTTHFKPTVTGGNKQPILGEDSVDWPAIIKACYEVGGTEWFIIEQERYLNGVSPMDCTQKSLVGLRAILKRMGV